MTDAYDARISSVESRLSYFESNSALFQVNDKAGGDILPPVDNDGGGSFYVRGEKKLYLVVALREYTKQGNLVSPAASSQNPDEEDLLPTWDYVRLPE